MKGSDNSFKVCTQSWWELCLEGKDGKERVKHAEGGRKLVATEASCHSPVVWMQTFSVLSVSSPLLSPPHRAVWL